MKKRYLLYFLSFYFLGCNGDNDPIPLEACGVNNPIQDLAWLREEAQNRENNPTEETQFCYIEQARLNDSDVFIYQDCNPFVDKVPPIFDCDGTRIGFLSDPISNDLTDFCVIWRPDDFACIIDFSCIREN